MRLVQFGAVLLPEEDGKDSYNSPMRSSLHQLQGGSFDLDGGGSHPKSRTITRSFVIMDNDYYTIQEKVDELESEFSEGRKVLKALTRDGDYRQTFAKAIDVTYEYAPGDLGVQTMKVVFEVDYPYWIASEDEPVYLNQGYTLDGTWNFSPGNYEAEVITTSPHTFTITVPEGVRIPRGYIVIDPRAGGSVEGITVANAANGMSFTYAGEVTDADQLVIRFLTKTVELNDVGDYDNFNTPAAQADWMILEVGANIITVTIDTVVGTTDLYWQWSKHYK
jgi:hypothetical protein